MKMIGRWVESNEVMDRVSWPEFVPPSRDVGD